MVTRSRWIPPTPWWTFLRPIDLSGAPSNLIHAHPDPPCRHPSPTHAPLILPCTPTGSYSSIDGGKRALPYFVKTTFLAASRRLPYIYFWTWDVANPRTTTSIYLFGFYCHGRWLSQEAYHLGNFLRICTLASIWYLILFIYFGTLWIKFCSWPYVFGTLWSSFCSRSRVLELHLKGCMQLHGDLPYINNLVWLHVYGIQFPSDHFNDLVLV